MKKLVFFVSAVVALLVGWQAFQSGGLKGIAFPTGVGTTPTSTDAPPPRGQDTIRIASFNIQVFGEDKLADPAVMETLVQIVRNFDVVAVQEIRAQQQDILPHFVALLNADGQYHYEYVIGPRLGRTASKEQYAFIFDRASIEVDRLNLYTVDDPDDLLHREPLVGWFRARGPAPEEAFTFTLANIHTDPDEVDRELDVLDDVFYAVRDDRRKEDDTIILGDFNANDANLRQLGQISGMFAVVRNTPTNTRGTKQYDNILFQETATPE
jgi:endonuclease/exonuclease/phosphatase family metal-dependent hydrolase